MAASTIVEVVVTAKDQATAVINAVGNSFEQLGGMSAKAKQGADIVSGAFLGVAAAGLSVSGVSVKMASDFQSSMTLIQTQAGASSKEVDTMSKAIMNLAPAVGQTPKALADALFYIESAGYRGSKALDILKLSAEGAAVGHSDLTKTADALTTVMNSGIKGVKNATDAMGVMNAIVGNGKMHMEDLIGALSSGLLPAGRAVGVSIQDLGAALDVMTNNGIPAQEAATRLRMTLSLIEAPTSAASKALGNVGLSSRKLADDMRNGGLISAVTDLNNHMTATQSGTETMVKGTKMTATQLTNLGDTILTTNDRLTKLKSETAKTSDAKKALADQIKTTQDKLGEYSAKLGGANTVIKSLGGSTLDAVGQAQLLTKAFGGARSGTVMELLTQQTDQLKNRLTGINATSKNFGESWQKTQQDNGFAMQKLNATVQTLMVQYGQALLPVVTKVANFISDNLVPTITKVTKFFEQHKVALAALAALITGVLIVAIAALGVTIWFSLIAPVLAFVSAGGFIVLIIAGIGAAIAFLAVLVNTHMKEIQGILKAVGTFFTNLWKEAIAEGQKVVVWIQTQLHTAINNITKFFKTVWADVIGVFTGFIKFLTSVFSPLFTAYINITKLELIVIWDFFVLVWAGIQAVLLAFGKWLTETFGPIVSFFFDLLKTMLNNNINFWKTIWNEIMTLLKQFGSWLNSVFGPIINIAFAFIRTLLTNEWNFWLSIWNTITGLLTGFGNWIGSTFTGMIDGAFKWIQTSLQSLSDGWTKIWNGIKSFVTGIADDILGVVKNMINGVIGFFNNIIKGANNVGSKVPGYIKIPTIQTFQTGGIVPGAIGSPTLILAHGGETVTPVGTSRGSDGGSGGSITLNVNVGLYAGAETDKRNIAKQLYSALLQLAQSRHQTVAQMMGG